MPSPTAYILCTSPRSGSTLLCALLRDSGVAGHPKSYFHRPSLAEWSKGLDLEPNTPRSDIVAEATRQGRGNTDIFGLRLQRHSAAFFFDQLRDMHPAAQTDAQAVTAQFGPTRYLHLHRADKLAQAVSLVRANQSGLWHRNADGSELQRTAPPQTPTYDQNAIANELATVTTYDAEWEAWFTREGIAPLRLDYDTLAADPNATLARVLSHLDLPPITPPAPAVAKLADDINADWIARFKADTT
ncbi:Stf0 sulfotransferase family protein [Tateyamaria omphalii]|uniref:Stf0 family sulfotransferase n=1 Tax=Tateyamaria omphalii TaxID=299262 RepID=UPI001C99116B|nr:Stf0 family sulfotransferase [Tateyamaria omphalii]MBY5933463.1 Stf0 sulfotransferase family protein [Tateyamaria omphalii]